jgi:hypothetical protein
VAVLSACTAIQESIIAGSGVATAAVAAEPSNEAASGLAKLKPTIRAPPFRRSRRDNGTMPWVVICVPPPSSGGSWIAFIIRGAAPAQMPVHRLANLKFSRQVFMLASFPC